MTAFVALLRAVNVGGTGMLPMKDLAALCAELGFQDPRTYIQSGNVVFVSGLAEPEIKNVLETALAKRMGKRIDVLVRSAAELQSVLAANPFPDAKPAQLGVMFLSESPPPNLLSGLVIPGREEVRLGKREIFIHYPDGMGRSKLKLPAAGTGTMRNLHTVAKLVAMMRSGGAP